MSRKAEARRDSWRWKAAAAAIVGLLLFGAVALQYSLEGSTRASSGSTDSTPFEAGRSILDVLGGARQSLAAILWTKTDDLFHSYLGHSLAKEDLIFPYFWLITRLDPNFEMPYYFASYTLCTMGKIDEGFDLALEGIRNNPRSYLLQQNLAEIYLYFKRDPEKALYHINRAILLSQASEEETNLSTAELAPIKSLIEKVISGEAKLPSLSELEKLRQEKAIEECEECGHEHEHEEEHEHDHEQ